MSDAPHHWFEPIAAHMGSAYLRYSFTKGTRQEIDFLMTALDLQPGIQAKVCGVPVLECHYGISNGRYALKVDQLLSSSNMGWLGANNV